MQVHSHLCMHTHEPALHSMIMWYIHVQVLLPFLKIGENSAEFDNPVPIFQGTAWLSGVGLISHHELCLYHTKKRNTKVNKIYLLQASI